MQLNWKNQHLDENNDNMLNVEEEFFLFGGVDGIRPWLGNLMRNEEF
jgi:hypothetical protein